LKGDWNDGFKMNQKKWVKISLFQVRSIAIIKNNHHIFEVLSVLKRLSSITILSLKDASKGMVEWGMSISLHSRFLNDVRLIGCTETKIILFIYLFDIEVLTCFFFYLHVILRLSHVWSSKKKNVFCYSKFI